MVRYEVRRVPCLKVGIAYSYSQINISTDTEQTQNVIDIHVCVIFY
jgi:hypothetical protein